MSEWLDGIRRYPLHWRLLDLIDGAVERYVPRLVVHAVPLLMLAPALLLIGLLVIGLGILAEQSLHLLDRKTYLLDDAYTLANYAAVFSRSDYVALALRSIVAAVALAVLTLLLGFPYAYVMARTPSQALKKLLLCCVFFPLLLGTVVRGLAWLVVLGREGLVNQLLGLVGLQLPLIYNMTGVVIGLVQLYLPLAVIMIAPALTAIEEEIDEAAQSLGATWTRALRSVILPMAAPGLANAFVLVMTLVYSDVAIPGLLGGGRADFITNAIYRAYLETGERGVGAALCVVTTGIATGMIAVLFLARGWIARARERRHA
jgi:putative spermidine/putrescine transport system permease protein